MATGDKNDQYNRLKSLMPVNWFGDDSSFINALLSGFATINAFIYSMIVYAKLQTRISTATDGWLDMIAADFFGGNIERYEGQSDESFRSTIKINLFRERATRASVIRVLEDITGRTPLVFEPQRPLDTGAYGAPNSGYGINGGYGSMLMPYQALVTAYRPTGSGIPFLAGYGVSTAGYSVASQSQYSSLDMINGFLKDSDIYSAIDSVKPYGTIAWVRIVSGEPQVPTMIGIDYSVGVSVIY